MTKLLLNVALVIGASVLGIWCIKTIIETYYNIRVLNDEARHLGRYPRKNSGIVFNKKTNKLENGAGEVILPF